jgi:hypothetical protein
MKILEMILVALPRWVLALAAGLFIGAMVVSLITGEPLTLGGLSFGWSRPQVERVVVSQPRSELEWQQRWPKGRLTRTWKQA